MNMTLDVEVNAHEKIYKELLKNKLRYFIKIYFID